MNEPPIRPFDFRLVPAALVGWGTTIAGILLGSTVVVAAAIALALASIVVFAARERLGERAFGVVAMTVIGCCYSAAAGVHVWMFETSPAFDAAQQRAWVSASVVVSEDPRRIRSMGPETVSIKAELVQLDVAGASYVLGGAMVVLAPVNGWDRLVPGQAVVLRGRLSVPDRADLTVALVRVHGPPLHVDDPGVVASAASTVRTALSAAAFDALPSDRAGLLPGLVVGDVSRLPEEVESDFRAAGLTHLTAVSGANFSILLGAVLLLTRAVGIGPRASAAVCALVLLAFVVIARPSPSVSRAAVMGGIGLLALITGRRRQAVPALCTAVLGLIAWSPALAVDRGFALSVAATTGLVVLSPVWVDWLRSKGWGRGPAEVVAVAAAAHVVTAPIVASMAGTFSVVGVLANVVVAPMVAPITVVGVVAAVLAPWARSLASLVLELSSAPLWWLISVARWAATVPGSSVATPGGVSGAAVVIVLTTAIVWSLRSRIVRKMLAGAAVATIIVWIGFLLVR